MATVGEFCARSELGPLMGTLVVQVLVETRLVSLHDAPFRADGSSITLRRALPTSRDAEEYEDNVLGLTVREITTDVRIALNLAQDVQGVIVRRVKSGSPAQAGKMGPGVIVLAIGQQKVTSLDEYKAVIQRMSKDRPAEISVFARIGANTGFFRIALRWDNK